MSEYHTLSVPLRNMMSAAKHAALQLDRANCGSFVTTAGLRQARAAAEELAALAIDILDALPEVGEPAKIVSLKRGRQ